MIPELNCLLSDVEKAYGRKIQTITDFEALSVVIEHETGELLSTSTLKRLWGYVSGTLSPRKSTIDILCKFIGKRDFSAYCKGLRDDKTVSSRFFSSKVIESDSLPVETCLLLGFPLYIPALHRPGEPSSVSYIAGAVSGLNRLDVL